MCLTKTTNDDFIIQNKLFIKDKNCELKKMYKFCE